MSPAPWGTPSLIYNGYRVFPGDKTTGEWRWPPTPFSAEVKERVELYLYSRSGPSWPVLGWNLLLPFSMRTAFPMTKRNTENREPAIKEAYRWWKSWSTGPSVIYLKHYADQWKVFVVHFHGAWKVGQLCDFRVTSRQTVRHKRFP